METFSEFLKRRESISSDYINGNSDLLAEISTQEDPATFFRRLARSSLAPRP